MAKQVIILDQTINDVWANLQGVFWFPITSAGTLKPQSNGSVWSKASPQESAQIESGAVQEESFSLPVPVGLAMSNATAVQAWLQAMWNNRNAQINGVGQNQFANVIYDPAGGGWVQD